MSETDEHALPKNCVAAPDDVDFCLRLIDFAAVVVVVVVVVVVGEIEATEALDRRRRHVCWCGTRC